MVIFSSTGYRETARQSGHRNPEPDAQQQSRAAIGGGSGFTQPALTHAGGSASDSPVETCANERHDR
jgi:hypothetical protein